MTIRPDLDDGNHAIAFAPPQDHRFQRPQQQQQQQHQQQKEPLLQSPGMGGGFAGNRGGDINSFGNQSLVQVGEGNDVADFEIILFDWSVFCQRQNEILWLTIILLHMMSASSLSSCKCN